MAVKSCQYRGTRFKPHPYSKKAHKKLAFPGNICKICPLKLIIAWSIVMSAKIELSAQPRAQTGKRASRRFRKQDHVLATLYGAQKQPSSVTLEHHKVLKALENEAFYSSILTMHFNNEAEKVVVKAIQRHPSLPRILHMDFLRINPKEKLTMQIPLHFTGDNVAPGVKAGGVISHLMNEIEVRCLPADLPEFINVDLSHLEMDQSVYLADLKLPAGVEIMAFTHGKAEEHNKPVANVHMPHIIEEPIETEAPQSAEVESIKVASDKERAEAAEAPKEGKGK
jgi:large subunit ribosomal protein L25